MFFPPKTCPFLVRFSLIFQVVFRTLSGEHFFEVPGADLYSILNNNFPPLSRMTNSEKVRAPLRGAGFNRNRSA